MPAYGDVQAGSWAIQAADCDEPIGSLCDAQRQLYVSCTRSASTSSLPPRFLVLEATLIKKRREQADWPPGRLTGGRGKGDIGVTT